MITGRKQMAIGLKVSGEMQNEQLNKAISHNIVYDYNENMVDCRILFYNLYYSE